MTTQTRNEAAERLRNGDGFDNIVTFSNLLDEALAAERRATVERIKNAIKEARPFTWRRVEANPSTGRSIDIELGVVVAILDEVADAPREAAR